MYERTVPVGQQLRGASLVFHEPSNATWGVDDVGQIVSVRLLDGRVTVHGRGYLDPVAALPGTDGLTVVTIEQAGLLWLASREAADRADALLAVDLGGEVLAAAHHPDPTSLVVLVRTGANAPELIVVELAGPEPATATTIGSPLPGATAIAVDPDRRDVTVLTVSATAEVALVVIDLDNGAEKASVTAGLPAFTAIVTDPDPTVAGVVGLDEQGALTAVARDGTVGAPEQLSATTTGLTRWGTLLLTTSDDALIATEWQLDAGPLELSEPLGPLFVNGYASLEIDPASVGLTRDDLTLDVVEGPDAGRVSAALEPPPPEPDGRFTANLVAGFQPGEFQVVAVRTSDGVEVARRRFRVTTLWPDDVVGPPVHLTGAQQTFRLMNWGGSGAADYLSDPAPEQWRVLVVLVETKDRGWGPLASSGAAAWKDRTIGGGDSLRTFYEEVSYRNTPAPPGSPLKGTTMDLVGNQVFGPVAVDAGWGDLFEPKAGTGLERGWRTKPTGKVAIAGAISSFMADRPDGHAAMAAADSIVIVVRSATDKPTPMSGTTPAIPTRYCWGHAGHTEFWRKHIPTSTYTQGSKPVTFVTDAYPAGLVNAPIPGHTLCHEIGHNLGLADLYDVSGDYPAEVNARTAHNADLMTSSKPLPHFSIANRIRLGWLDRNWVRRFDFSANPNGDSVTLQATEALGRGGPPAGRSAGIEVPIADGWSYFFELRQERAGQIGDQSLERLTPTARLVLGTDVRPSGGMAARPPILLLAEDVDGDGPVLAAAGEDYRDSDTTNPERMHDFALKVAAFASPDADSATVDVTYLAAHRPQLQIRPAPGRGNFQSPDIRLASPLPMPSLGAIKGAVNKIEVTLRNLGTLPAEDVRVHVKWLPFTTSAGAWVPLADPAPFNVPASAVAMFTVPWPIPSSVKVDGVEAQHFCVRVEIDRYRDPAHPEHEEIVVFDNWAQSNFDASPLSFGSPSERVTTAMSTSNPLSRPATYLLGLDQSSPWYRVYLGNAWLRLEPDEQRGVALAYESLAGDPVDGAEFDKHLERITNEVNHVAVTSWLLPEDTDCDTPREWWGVSLDLRAGRRCWFTDIRLGGEVVTAKVLTSFDGRVEVVTSGTVHLAVWFEDRPEEIFATTGSIFPDGTAFVVVGGEVLQGVAEGRRLWGTLGREHGGSFAAARSPITALT